MAKTRKRRARNASGRFTSRRKSSKRRKSVRRSRRRASVRRSSRRRRRSVRRATATVSVNPRRRRRGRRVRRNPGFSVRGITGQLMDVGVATATILGGKVATNYISNMIPFLEDGVAMRVLKRGLIGFGLGWAGSKFVSREVGRNLFIGALLSPTEELLRSLPGVGGLFSGYYAPAGVPAGVTAPGVMPNDISGYFQPAREVTGGGGGTPIGMGSFDEFYSA